MFNLLHPAALWTLVALALPPAIHLFRPPPRTVRLGSLHFLENTPRHPLRNLRWREILLLCTRLGLLGALSLLLAGPRWTTAPPAGPRRWALLDPTAAPAGESLARWRDLRRAGYELHRLAPDFPTAPDDPAPAPDAAAPDLWSLLCEADAELPVGSTLAVFSPGRLAALRGVRPVPAHCKVEWVQTADAAANTPHNWVASALGTRLLEGHSDAHATTFTIRPADGSAAEHSTTRATLSVLILHDAEHTKDAWYVEAAVRAAADDGGRPVNVQDRDITPDVDNAAVTDWTFWLSTRPVSEGLAGRVPRIVRYVGGDTATAADEIVAPSGDAADDVRLWKRVVSPLHEPPEIAWWTDGPGNPVLTYSHPAAGERWDIFTRIDPDWNDLPRTTALSAWMRTLLFPEVAGFSGDDPTHDCRLADPTQGLPANAPVAATTPILPPADQPFKDLLLPLWTLAALLFAAERFLSLRRRKISAGVLPLRPELSAVVASR